MESKKDTSKHSAADLSARRARGESLTDLTRVRSKSAAELERDIQDDPDFRDLDENWHASAKAIDGTTDQKLDFALTMSSAPRIIEENQQPDLAGATSSEGVS